MRGFLSEGGLLFENGNLCELREGHVVGDIFLMFQPRATVEGSEECVFWKFI